VYECKDPALFKSRTTLQKLRTCGEAALYPVYSVLARRSSMSMSGVPTPRVQHFQVQGLGFGV
jgi:hypothetical protein